MKIREPLYKIIWAGKDVAKALEPYLLDLTYTDHLHGESDEADMTFEDRDDLWKGAWYPVKGDLLDISIGVSDEEGERWLKAGTFKIDEINYSGSPDIVTVKGLASYVTEPQRQKKTKAWENVKMSQVITDLASRINLEPDIEIDPDLTFKRLDQKNLGDLAYIKSLAEKYGYNTKIDSNRLIFRKPESLEKRGFVATIERGDADLISYNLDDKSTGIYKACEVAYWDPAKKVQLKHTEKAGGIINGDVLKISERVENLAQAIQRAKAELKRANKFENAGELTVSGNPYLVAGANVVLLGFGKLEGAYIIEEARHAANKGSGYTTSAKIRRVERHYEIEKIKAAKTLRKKRKRK